MSFPCVQISRSQHPTLLHEIPEPPKELYLRGALPENNLKLIAIVGSRKYSTYGKQVVDHLVAGLTGYNVGIVSGLALGIDALSHEAALQHNLYTLAIPGSGLNDSVMYPARNKPLARRILERGGGLLSEFEPSFKATKWSFLQRNRIMAGITSATIVVEATERSGTLVTARLAVDYNRELMVVPGNIFSQNTRGPHQFLKLGAMPVTDASDIIELLQLTKQADKPKPLNYQLSPAEERLLRVLSEPKDITTIASALESSVPEINIALSMLEIKGLIRVEGAQYQAVI